MLITLLEIPAVLRVQAHSREAIVYRGFPYLYQPFDPGKLSEAAGLGDDRFELRLRTKAPTITDGTIGEWLRRSKGSVGSAVRLLIFEVSGNQLPSPEALVYSSARSITKASMGATDCLLSIGSLSTPLDAWVGL